MGTLEDKLVKAERKIKELLETITEYIMTIDSLNKFISEKQLDDEFISWSEDREKQLTDNNKT